MADMTPTEAALEGAEEKLWSEIKKFCRTNDHGPVFAAMDVVVAAAAAERDAVLAASVPPLELKPHDEAHLRAWAKKDPEQFHAVKSIALLLVEWDFARALVGKAREELTTLRRQIEFALPSLPTTERELTLEEMRAIKLRWAFGPEKYQADADALIGTVIALRARAEKAESDHADMLSTVVIRRILIQAGVEMTDRDCEAGILALRHRADEAIAELERVKTHCDAHVGVGAAAAARALREDRDQLARDLATAREERTRLLGSVGPLTPEGATLVGWTGYEGEFSNAEKAFRIELDAAYLTIAAEREKYEKMKQAFDAEDNSTVAFADAKVEKARDELIAERRAHAATEETLRSLRGMLLTPYQRHGHRLDCGTRDARATCTCGYALIRGAVGSDGSEYIVAAAIEHKLGGVWSVPRPARHNHVIKLMQSRDRYNECERDHTQGFLTSTGRFVSREEAKRVAIAAGQVPAGGAAGLFSEDVW